MRLKFEARLHRARLKRATFSAAAPSGIKFEAWHLDVVTAINTKVL
jgi:succinylarginine dihydrolase